MAGGWGVWGLGGCWWCGGLSVALGFGFCCMLASRLFRYLWVGGYVCHCLFLLGLLQPDLLGVGIFFVKIVAFWMKSENSVEKLKVALEFNHNKSLPCTSFL